MVVILRGNAAVRISYRVLYAQKVANCACAKVFSLLLVPLINVLFWSSFYNSMETNPDSVNPQGTRVAKYFSFVKSLRVLHLATIKICRNVQPYRPCYKTPNHTVTTAPPQMIFTTTSRPQARHSDVIKPFDCIPGCTPYTLAQL